jgi:hypothetical protein
MPDDIIFYSLGLSKKKIKISWIFWTWMGKNITLIFYVTLPILLLLGFNAYGIEHNDVSSVITEAVMLLITITIMFFVMSFNWNKYIVKRSEKRESQTN